MVLERALFQPGEFAEEEFLLAETMDAVHPGLWRWLRESLDSLGEEEFREATGLQRIRILSEKEAIQATFLAGGSVGPARWRLSHPCEREILHGLKGVEIETGKSAGSFELRYFSPGSEEPLSLLQMQKTQLCRYLRNLLLAKEIEVLAEVQLEKGDWRVISTWSVPEKTLALAFRSCFRRRRPRKIEPGRENWRKELGAACRNLGSLLDETCQARLGEEELMVRNDGQEVVFRYAEEAGPNLNGLRLEARRGSRFPISLFFRLDRERDFCLNSITLARGEAAVTIGGFEATGPIVDLALEGFEGPLLTIQATTTSGRLLVRSPFLDGYLDLDTRGSGRIIRLGSGSERLASPSREGYWQVDPLMVKRQGDTWTVSCGDLVGLSFDPGRFNPASFLKRAFFEPETLF